MRLLRTTGPTRIGDPASGGEPRQLWVRRATHNARPLLTMHCFSRGDEYLIASDVYPADGLHVEPLRAGPYVFSSHDEAESFAREASLVLQYLGCDVTESDA